MVGPLVINSSSHRAAISESELFLTPIEFELLKLLASRPGQKIIHTVNGIGYSFSIPKKEG